MIDQRTNVMLKRTTNLHRSRVPCRYHSTAEEPLEKE
jgi:hypothetical protein